MALVHLDRGSGAFRPAAFRHRTRVARLDRNRAAPWSRSAIVAYRGRHRGLGVRRSGAPCANTSRRAAQPPSSRCNGSPLSVAAVPRLYRLDAFSSCGEIRGASRAARRASWAAPSSAFASSPPSRRNPCLGPGADAGHGQPGFPDHARRDDLRDVPRDRRLRAAQNEASACATSWRTWHAVSTLSELSGSLAHELNQPLGAILRNAEAAQILLATRQPDLAELRAIVARHPQRRPPRGRDHRAHARLPEAQQPRAASGGAATARAGRARARAADAAGAPRDPRLRDARSLPLVLVDRVQLSQVLLNLLVNGIDASLNRRRRAARGACRSADAPTSAPWRWRWPIPATASRRTCSRRCSSPL